MYKDTIVAIATPPGEGGIGIVRLSGSESLNIGDKIFKDIKKIGLKNCEERKLNYGHIVDPKNDKMIDEVMVVYMLGEKTYTREDVLEIHCHGGVIPIKRILELVIEQGARPADRGEFTKRAFLNGRVDLAQAESVIDLIKAKSELNFDVSFSHLNGAMTKKVKELQQKLLDVISYVEASIDFAEDDIGDISTDDLKIIVTNIYNHIEKMIVSSRVGKIIREGIRTVILGKPNVGKSSLMNALLREDRAIVTDVPGTTRDTIEEYINLRGMPLRIIDTAGIRDTDDKVEKLGIERAKDMLYKSDLIIAIFDISKPLEAEDEEIIEMISDKNSIVLYNKTDLDTVIDEKELQEKLAYKRTIRTSLLEEDGIEELEETILEMFFKDDIKMNEDVIVTSVRQRDILIKAKDSIQDAIDALNMEMPLDCIVVDLRNCSENLGKITGDSTDESVIDNIFEKFCIGK